MIVIEFIIETRVLQTLNADWSAAGLQPMGSGPANKVRASSFLSRPKNSTQKTETNGEPIGTRACVFIFATHCAVPSITGRRRLLTQRRRRHGDGGSTQLRRLPQKRKNQEATHTHNTHKKTRLCSNFNDWPPSTRPSSGPVNYAATPRRPNNRWSSNYRLDNRNNRNPSGPTQRKEKKTIKPFLYANRKAKPLTSLKNVRKINKFLSIFFPVPPTKTP